MRHARISIYTLLLSVAILSTACRAAPPEEWRSIPLMDGAVVIASDEDSIEYHIASPLPEIGNFYEQRLEQAGWTYLGLGEGVGGIFLVYRQADLFLEVSAYGAVDVEDTRVVISLR